MKQRIFTFIVVNGAYLGFWLTLWLVSFAGLYVTVRLAVEHAIRNGRM